MATFRKVQLTISPTTGYGQYIVSAAYRGSNVAARTTDSEIFDWLNDDSNKEKHLDAKRAAYLLIRNAYENN